MRSINFKKIFSVIISANVLLCNVSAGADNGSNFQNRGSGNDIKKIIKKAAPYAAVGVPTMAAVTAAVVIFAKNHGKNNNTDANHGAVDHSHTICDRQRQVTPKDIDELTAKGELPGIKFYRVKKYMKTAYYFYIITDLVEAKKYFAFLNAPLEEQMIIKWQNHSIRKKDIDNIFGNAPKFKEHFSKVTEKEKQVSKYESREILLADGTSGKPVIKTGMIDYDVMTAGRNKAACPHINDEFLVESAEVNPRNASLPTATQISADDIYLEAEQPRQGGAKAKLGKLKRVLSSHHFAATPNVQKSNDEKNSGPLEQHLERGYLPGFKFYRYKKLGSLHGTRHCYIITDYEKAKTSLGVTDEKKSDVWKKVVLYQNRWLSKKKKSRGNGWSFEELFGFDSGFGMFFGKMISEVKAKNRWGTECLKSLPRNSSKKWGGCVFEKGSEELSAVKYRDEIASFITSSDLDAGSFQKKIDEFHGSFI